MKQTSSFKPRLCHHITSVNLSLLFCLCLSGAAPAATVTNCTEAELRLAVAAGGTINFACDGTILLTSTLLIGSNTALDATGHRLILSGNDRVRVLYVGTNITLNAINLTIVHGLATNGAGLYNDGGLVTLQNCQFQSNSAVGGASVVTQEGSGGAIFNVGTLSARSCVFLQNSATGGSGSMWGSGPGAVGSGGAIANLGSLSAVFCSFGQNSAIGGSGAVGMPPIAGASGGMAFGGAIYSLGTLTVDRSLLASNSAVGGNGGGGMSGAIFGTSGGSGGPGASGCGGALFVSGPSALINCTLASNQARGGYGGSGGAGAVIQGRTGTVYLPGGSGANGGSGQGAIADPNGSLRITNCTVANNTSTYGSGGFAGTGGPGSGTSGGDGTAYGAVFSSGTMAAFCLIASNSPANLSGGIADIGYNLSSDASCAFSSYGSLNSTDPRLGSLSDNGGPTLTMALLAGSPAIDAIPSGYPATDQRGAPRPYGLAADIGAFEAGAVPSVLPVITQPPQSQTAEAGSPVQFHVTVTGFPQPTCQWFFDGSANLGCTSRTLQLPSVLSSQSGAYTMIASNAAGSVTSAPALLNVIAPVERRPVPALTLTGKPGSRLNLESTEAFGSTPNWATFDGVTLSNASQFYFHLSTPLPPQRFYRVWQANPSGIPLSLDLHMVPAITLTGTVGSSVRLDYINQFGPIDAWVSLATVNLTNTSQLYFDTSSIGQPPRLWRLVPVP